MSVITMDTVQFSRRMQKVGLQKEVADELAEDLKDVQLESASTLVIKQDLELAKKDIIIKLGSLMAIGVGTIGVMIKF